MTQDIKTSIPTLHSKTKERTLFLSRKDKTQFTNKIDPNLIFLFRSNRDLLCHGLAYKAFSENKP